MTKYILHGGATGIPNRSNATFYQEWAKSFAPGYRPAILLVYFSRPEEIWPELAADDEKKFQQHARREADFKIADPRPEFFLEQVRRADIIYVRGGSTDQLLAALSPYWDDFSVALRGKVYAGSSAGVMCLSHETRSDTTPWQIGLGLLPINSFVHYTPDFQDDLAAHQLACHNNFEYLLLPETEFVVREY